MALLGCFITVLLYFDSFVILFFHNNMKEKVVYMFTIYEHVHWNFYDGMSKMIKRLQIYNVFAHSKSVCQNQLYCKHFVTCCFESLRCCATIKYRRRYLINILCFWDSGDEIKIWCVSQEIKRTIGTLWIILIVC